MENIDRHFYLYAKGWYKRGKQINDLRHIVAMRCALDFQYVRDYDVLHVLSSLAVKHATLEKFINQFVDTINYSSHKTEIEKMVATLLYFLQFADVKDIPFELGEPDENILPLKN